MYRVIMVAVAVVLVVAGCTEADPGPGADPIPADAPSAGATVAAAPAAGDPVDEAVADFAGFAEVEPAEVEVVVDEKVMWRDGSLGCPDPDTGYSQELVEGYRIVLRAGDGEVSYHGKRGLPPFYCADPDPEGTVDDGPEGSETTDGPDAAGESG